MKTSTNIIDIILNNNYTTAEVALNGFYMIDIIFNNEPYYYTISNKKIIKKTTPAGAFYGYAFYLNGQPVAVGEGGRYHLESDALIDIYDLKISDDFNISYKASFFKQSDSEILVHTYPFVPDDDTVLTCVEHFCTPSAGNTNLIDSTYNRVDIEARAGAILEVNNRTIILGKTDFCSIDEDVSSIKYRGYINLDDINANPSSPITDSIELHFYLYTKGV